MLEKRITIFAGHFGSGKSEVAINYALQMRKIHDNVAILDFDIVNPFFRTADAKVNLEKHGVKVFLPKDANTNVESSNFPPEVTAVFTDKSMYAIFDVGGDDLGAKAISRFKKKFLKEDYEFIIVINTRRIFTDTIEKIVEMCERIAESAGIMPTGLVNNSNLLQFTTKEIIENGQTMVHEAGLKLGIPVAFVSGIEPYISEVKINDLNKLALEKNIHLPWDK
ncbi:MAG: hypothetical protein WCQ41_03085 [Bacillota bacterium]